MEETALNEALQTDFPTPKPSRWRRLVPRFVPLVLAVYVLGVADFAAPAHAQDPFALRPVFVSGIFVEGEDGLEPVSEFVRTVLRREWLGRRMANIDVGRIFWGYFDPKGAANPSRFDVILKVVLNQVEKCNLDDFVTTRLNLSIRAECGMLGGTLITGSANVTMEGSPKDELDAIQKLAVEKSLYRALGKLTSTNGVIGDVIFKTAGPPSAVLSIGSEEGVEEGQTCIFLRGGRQIMRGVVFRVREHDSEAGIPNYETVSRDIVMCILKSPAPKKQAKNK